MRIEVLDLADLGSVRAFAARFAAAGTPLDILLNNAGLGLQPIRALTVDGFERQFGTNHLGHFALTGLLMPALLRATAPRVVAISSIAHRRGRIDFADLQGARRYSGNKAYGQSKLANLLFAFELDRRARAAGLALTSVAAHPGVARTDFFANAAQPALIESLANVMLRVIGQDAGAGALPGLYAATMPDVRGGQYWGADGFLELRGPPLARRRGAPGARPRGRRPPLERVGGTDGRDLRLRQAAGLIVAVEVAGLCRRQRRETAAVGLEVEERRAVEAVEAAHQHVGALDADERPRPTCRSGSGARANAAKTCRAPRRRSAGSAAPSHAATGAANRSPRPARTAPSHRGPRSRARKRGCDRPVRRGGPGAGSAADRVQGVPMRPMKTRPASVGGGASTATSPARTSFRRTMSQPGARTSRREVRAGPRPRATAPPRALRAASFRVTASRPQAPKPVEQPVTSQTG